MSVENGLSSSFIRAGWRGTTNTDGEVIGISLNLSGERVVRYALDVDSALLMAESIIEYASSYGRRTSSHSESSSGNPSVAVSTPEE